MKKSILTCIISILFILTTVCQFTVKTYSKDEMGIKVRSPFIAKSVFINYGYLKNRADSSSFFEHKNKICYAQNNQVYELSDIDSDIKNVKENINNHPNKNASDKITPKDTLKSYLKQYSHIIQSGIVDQTIDRKGGIWVATKDSGLVYIAENKFTRYTKKNSLLPTKKIYDIQLDSNDHLVIATRKGICRFENDSITVFNKLTNEKQIKGVNRLYLLENNNILFTTKTNKIGYSDGNQYHMLDVTLRGDGNITKDEYNNFWIDLGNRKGMVLKEPNRKPLILSNLRKDYHIRISDTYKDSYDNIWIMAKNAIGLIHRDRSYVELHSFGKMKETCIYDKDPHRLWFLSEYGGGYYNYELKLFSNINSINNIRNDKYPLSKVALESFTNDKPLLSFGLHKDGALDYNYQSISYSHNDILSNKINHFLYFQYNIVSIRENKFLFDRIKLREHSTLLLTNDDKEYDLTYELNGGDIRPLNTYADSDGNFWIDTPTQIHQVVIDQ